MNRDDRKKQSPLGKIIALVIVLAFSEPEILGVLLAISIPFGIGWLIFRSLRKTRGTVRETSAGQQPLDDCPKPICFHKDKGMHHVLKGNGQDPWDRPNREIDPWDRPDIDIRKYQRR